MHWRLVFWLMSGLFSGWALMLARARGRWSLGWGVLGLLFGPFGGALAYLLPVEGAAIEIAGRSGGMRRCATCVILAPGYATTCRLCGESLETGNP